MKKTSIASVLVFAVLIVFASVAIDQTTEKGWEKTVTLPSGEVILDMNGEWDVLDEFYGPFDFHDFTMSEIVTITHKGAKFAAIKQIGSKWVPKGAETIKGELNKDGFKAVYSYTMSLLMDGNFVWEECEWKISENGNKIALDCGKRTKRKLTKR